MMIARLGLALAVICFTDSHLPAQQDAEITKVGSRLAIRITGDLAKEIARCTGAGKVIDQPGIEMSGIATVKEPLKDGRITIEYTMQIKRDGETHLLMLTGAVDPQKITTRTIPKGSPTYAAPGGPKTGETAEERKVHELRLSSLKGLKLRNWLLTNEVDGD